MTDDEQRVTRKAVGNLIGLAIVAYVGKVSLLGGIPTHGIFLELTVFEWALLAWVFATPFFLARPGTPLRWWLYFGASCSIILLPILREYILHQAGRRPWMPDPHWWVKGGILTTCLILGPWTVACWKQRRGKVSHLRHILLGQSRGLHGLSWEGRKMGRQDRYSASRRRGH